MEHKKSGDSPASIKNTVYKGILSLISTGQLAPDSMVTEAMLIQRFNVSKSPVREALVQLCHEDVLESIPRHGYRVLPISPRNIAESTVLRRMLELGSLQSVLDNMTAADMDELREINDERKELIRYNKTVWALWENNIRFHLKLVSLSGNRQVYKALERCLLTFTRAYAQLFVAQGSVMYPDVQSPARHDFIIGALEAHNLFEVYEYISQDITYLEKRLLAGETAPPAGE